MTQATAPTKHYKYGPSSSKRWLACPFSAGSDDGETNDAAIFGNVCHEAAATQLAIGLPSFSTEEFNGVSVPDMIRPYVDFVNKLPGDSQHELQLESLTIAEHGGTIDTIKIQGTHGHVVDLKTGKWRVPADESTQLLCYLDLAHEHFPELETFTGTIVQPRVWKRPKSVTYTVGQLDQFHAQVDAATRSLAVIPGDHCGFCPLRRECEPGSRYNRERGWTY